MLDLDLQDDGHEEAAAEYDGWYLQTEVKEVRKGGHRSSNSHICRRCLTHNSSSKGMNELTIAFEYSFILKSLVT